MEGLAEPAGTELELLADGRDPTANPLVHPGRVGELALMAVQRGELALDVVGDVDGAIGPRRAHHPDLGHRPRLQPLGHQLWEGELVAGIGVDGTERGFSSGEVIGMAGVDPGQVSLRALGDDALGTHLTDDAGQVPTQVQRRLQPAVGVTEEDEVLDADLGSGGGLLATAHRADLAASDRRVEPAGVAVSDQAVRDDDAAVGPRRDGASGAEVDIVGVGTDDQRTFDRILVEHRASLRAEPGKMGADEQHDVRDPPMTVDARAQFEAIDEAALRRRRGAKWSRYPADVLPAWVADMDFDVAPPIADALRKAITDGDLGYPPDDQSSTLPTVFAARAANRWGWAPDPSLIHLIADVVHGLEHVVERLSAPGAPVVVTTPIYPPFLKVVRIGGRALIEVPLHPDGALDLDALAAAFARHRPPLMLLCSPHNPIGHVPSRSELAGLAALAAEHDVVVVADEIHADLVYPGAAHVPLATLDGHGSHTVTLTSASKAFNVAGLRCALAISGSAALAERLHGGAATGEMLRDPLGALGIVASLAAWSPEGDAWLSACLQVLERNRDTVAGWAMSLGIGHRPPEATYLAWLDFAPLGLGPNPSKWLLENAHVALSPGLDYGEPGSGFARLNFATSPAILDDVLGRIGTAIKAR